MKKKNCGSIFFWKNFWKNILELNIIIVFSMSFETRKLQIRRLIEFHITIETFSWNNESTQTKWYWKNKLVCVLLIADLFNCSKRMSPVAVFQIKKINRKRVFEIQITWTWNFHFRVIFWDVDFIYQNTICHLQSKRTLIFICSLT